MMHSKVSGDPEIACFHLLNDFSGSPVVLRTVLEGFIRRGMTVELFTSQRGVLDSIKPSNKYSFHTCRYRFSKYKVLTVLNYLCVQILTFFWAFKFFFRKNVVFYINTLLPVGPAIAGFIMRKKVICHCHENPKMKGFPYPLFAKIMYVVADRIICVSKYQKDNMGSKSKMIVIPNSVPESFIANLHPDPNKAYHRRNILMVSSAKLSKGIIEFINLANLLPEYHFTLILNLKEEEKQLFLKDKKISISDNLSVFSKTDDIPSFLNQSSLLINMSIPNLCIETFGMTVSEAQCAGLPCIVPCIGGVEELVDEGNNGFHCDGRDIEAIAVKISFILNNRDEYLRMAYSALNKARNKYNEYDQNDNIYKILVV